MLLSADPAEGDLEPTTTTAARRTHHPQCKPTRTAVTRSPGPRNGPTLEQQEMPYLGTPLRPSIARDSPCPWKKVTTPRQRPVRATGSVCHCSQRTHNLAWAGRTPRCGILPSPPGGPPPRGGQQAHRSLSTGSVDHTLHPPGGKDPPVPEMPVATIGPFPPLKRLKRIQCSERGAQSGGTLPTGAISGQQGSAGPDSWRQPQGPESRAQAEGGAPGGSHSRGLTTPQTPYIPAGVFEQGVESTPPGELYEDHREAPLLSQGTLPPSGHSCPPPPGGRPPRNPQDPNLSGAQRDTALLPPGGSFPSHPDPRSGWRPQGAVGASMSAGAPRGHALKSSDAGSADPRSPKSTPMIAVFSGPLGWRLTPAQDRTGSAMDGLVTRVRTGTTSTRPQGRQLQPSPDHAGSEKT